MKRILTYCAAFMLALILLPAGSLATTAESPIFLGGTGDDSCAGTLQLPNGNLILSLSSKGGRNGEPEYPGNVSKTWLLCLAPDGSTVWETTFGEEHKNGYTSLYLLTLNDDDTFTGTARYSISQFPQYRQEMTFSCADGSLLSQGDRIPEDADTCMQYFKHNGFTLISEPIMSGADDDYRILRMLDAAGNELWQLDSVAIGIGYPDGFTPAAQGTLLYGGNANTANNTAQATVSLVDPSGHAVWTHHVENLDNGDFFDGMVDSGGRFIAVGFCNNQGQGSARQLVLCIDIDTGAVIWQRVAGTADRRLPCRHLTELNGQYILCDSGDQYQSNLFETLDQDGYEVQRWTTSIPGYTMLTPRFFWWNGELWTENLVQTNDMDAVLERVVIPAS